HDGAVDAEKLYQDMLLVLGNISRYEMLCGVHNPTSDTWEARAARVLHYRGHEFVQHLPTRFRHPDND
ncbi:MAG TPA: hypothetical protein VFG56_02690, partial [Candidatus Saccharimonadales bacterium]|nr:hypothetical protein [Candidatus Saccharimonadales bacterium]